MTELGTIFYAYWLAVRLILKALEVDRLSFSHMHRCTLETDCLCLMLRLQSTTSAHSDMGCLLKIRLRSLAEATVEFVGQNVNVSAHRLVKLVFCLLEHSVYHRLGLHLFSCTSVHHLFISYQFSFAMLLFSGFLSFVMLWLEILSTLVVVFGEGTWERRRLMLAPAKLTKAKSQ